MILDILMSPFVFPHVSFVERLKATLFVALITSFVSMNPSEVSFHVSCLGKSFPASPTNKWFFFKMDAFFVSLQSLFIGKLFVASFAGKRF